MSSETAETDEDDIRSTKKQETHGNQESHDNPGRRVTDSKPDLDKAGTGAQSIYGDALLICCIFVALYFAWHVFAMGSGGVLYHGY